MEGDLLKLATSQGIWAVLSVTLILYILKTQEKRDKKQEERERKYQEIIVNLTDKLNVVEDIKTDIREVKEHVFRSSKV